MLRSLLPPDEPDRMSRQEAARAIGLVRGSDPSSWLLPGCIAGRGARPAPLPRARVAAIEKLVCRWLDLRGSPTHAELVRALEPLLKDPSVACKRLDVAALIGFSDVPTMTLRLLGTMGRDKTATLDEVVRNGLMCKRDEEQPRGEEQQAGRRPLLAPHGAEASPGHECKPSAQKRVQKAQRTAGSSDEE